MSLPDPFVFTKKTPYMQRIADIVRSDSVRYISGQIDPVKLGHLAAKFAARYAMPTGKVALLRAKRTSAGAARLLAWLDDSSGTIHWVLFYWPGDVPCAVEKWIDPKKQRISLTHYELVRITKPGTKAPVWTWKYERDQYHHLRDEIIAAIRLRQDARLEQIIHSLHRSPGFAGVREQVKSLWRLIKSEWRRVRSKNEPAPEIPKNIGYVRRLPDVGLPWSELMQSQPGANDGNTTESPRRKARRDSILVPAGSSVQVEKP